MSGWPFLGRDDELMAIEAAFADGGTVAAVIGGPAGMGKTRLAKQAVTRLGAAGCRAEWVTGTRSAAYIPFGAVAHLLPERLPVGADRLGLLKAAAENVAGWSGPGRAVIGVDDAHLLDPSSAAVIGHLATRRLAFFVVTSLDGTTLPDAVSTLVRDGEALGLRLTALPSTAVDRLVGHSLDGPLDGASRKRLHRLADGNPLVLREVLHGGLACGALRRHHGVWRLEGGHGAGGRAAELIAGRLRDVDAGTRTVLELVACGEPVELAMLERLAGEAALSSAEERGLIAVEREGARIRVRFAHPLYGEVVRARLPAGRARERWRHLAGAALAGPLRRRDDALRAAVWQLEGGAVTRPDVVGAGALEAVGRSDIALAERLARAARDAAPGDDADRLLAQILVYRGRGGEAADVLPTASATGPARTRTAITEAETLYWGAGDVRAAERALDRVAGEPDEELARGLRSWILLFDRRCPEALEAARRVLATPGADPLAVTWAAAAGTTAAGLLGRGDEAADIHRRGLAVALANRAAVPWGVANVEYGLCLAHLGAGDLGRAQAIADRGYRDTVDADTPLMAAAWAGHRGLVEVARGRPREADASLREAVAALDDTDMFCFVRWCLAGLAGAAALAGDPAAARSWLGRADDRPGAAPRLFDPWAGRWRSWTLAAEGATGEAVAEARRAAALTDGAPAEEALARYEVARLGGAADLDRLGELADGLGTPFAAALSRAAAGLAAGDGAALAGAAEDLASLGQDLLAAEMAAMAGRAYRRGGLRARAEVTTAWAAELRAACPDAHTPLLGDLPVELLTPREREILLLATGHSSRHIAERLGLSVRTVDNALNRAYAKLGLAGRAELRALLPGVRPSSHGGR
ncbi:helix-turn-helix transcriptional regulator [Actinomadura graeca]|uniref:Helix-turn-helix transcriptional regulator n=1 Tax=Actinomadura graeca TaxID=2750812 RepID=A0ABX8QTK6_9ACTN|nr:LuxR family transcriptional regulator [Actinomadura graeca]QXJ22115.1 helix-turn-helix transcriptional regulator [Actinomadura graeca]